MFFTTTEPLENAGPRNKIFMRFFHAPNSVYRVTLALVPMTVRAPTPARAVTPVRTLSFIIIIDIIIRLRHYDIARIPRIDLRARRALIRQPLQVHSRHVEGSPRGRKTRLTHQLEDEVLT